MLFEAKKGDHAGKTFLVIDQNGHAGYQARGDLVIWLDHAVHIDQIDTGDFM